MIRNRIFIAVTSFTTGVFLVIGIFMIKFLSSGLDGDVIIKYPLSRVKISGNHVIQETISINRYAEIIEDQGGEFAISSNYVLSPDRSKVAWSNSMNSVRIYNTDTGLIASRSFYGDFISLSWVSISECKIVHTAGILHIKL